MASAAVPLLPPAAFRATDPPRHRHDSRRARLRLLRDDTVDAPPSRGRRTRDQAARLVLDETRNVLVGS